jgi:hypothetical protein
VGQGHLDHLPDPVAADHLADLPDRAWQGMQERQLARVQEVQKAQDQYIQNVAGATDPAEQIAKANSCSTRASSPGEYDTLKEQGAQRVLTFD